MKAVLGSGALALALFFPACVDTSQGAKKIQWVQLDSIGDECKDPGFDVAGCYKVEGDTCFVYTKKATSETDKAVHMALGHEVRHCFQGDFHARLSY